MYKIQTLNKISEKGLSLLPAESYSISEDGTSPDGIILRSFKMHDMEIPESVKVIARAGAGVNNIPLTTCTEKGIVVFNAPGANANSVKELVIGAMLTTARDFAGGVAWTKTIADEDDVAKVVEKNKSRFAGGEIKGKKLGVIGLGAIGVQISNACLNLGMEVYGYDPYLTLQAAWTISSKINRSDSIEKILKECDYITVHVPLNEGTKGIINKENMKLMKKNAVILNFARGGIIDDAAAVEAVASGQIAKYVTDFPNNTVIGKENIICVPHLGASTQEAEENCAEMVAQQMKDYLENGNIVNSVNFPSCTLDINGGERIILASHKCNDVLNDLLSGLSEKGIQTEGMASHHMGEIFYNIIEVAKGSDIKDLIDEAGKKDCVIIARVID
ncbi:MAG: 3-phosphoglycerate dehydrogenase [Spirochaetaceae bacterium]|nr:3-phosphoglycerate dehydrogenase [Spirochaetaceae bacterium]